MRVGVYVDGYNLYYGGREVCGRRQSGWRWLDVRGLANSIVDRHQQKWPGAVVERVVYCTARTDAVTNPDGHRDQDIYLKALVAAKSVDYIEYGNYVARVKNALLATADKNGRPKVATSTWPLMVKDHNNKSVSDARFMVSYLHQEEKGSDVNVATHLLLDVLGNKVDAAIVISNDSDLRFPIRHARELVPVGTVNPRNSHIAGDLRGNATDGVGQHWWWKLTKPQYLDNQLPDPAGHFTKPTDW